MLRTLRQSKALKLLQMTCVVSAILVPTFSVAKTVCESLPGSIEVLEDAKEILTLGQYNSFFGFANRIANIDTNPEASDNTPEGILSRAFPGGFQTCSTIMSKMVSERFISEIVIFIDSQERVIFLGWDAIKVNDSWEIVKYQIEDNFEKIIEEWRS
ncbi:hypothetical protein [uncultured Tateyamaria sp.]|uniref:hypothetical protein n=1 Tax=uncultured Tateyamaria sp. TaxID=455651 RepID=UPI00261D636A|nr:hypothetical protein [uncultured Tateyamaria sp.]